MRYQLPPPTHAQAVERGRKGGIQSGIARRRKKKLKEALSLILEIEAEKEQASILLSLIQ